jgi:hypothetical protein
MYSKSASLTNNLTSVIDELQAFIAIIDEEN